MIELNKGTLKVRDGDELKDISLLMGGMSYEQVQSLINSLSDKIGEVTSVRVDIPITITELSNGVKEKDGVLIDGGTTTNYFHAGINVEEGEVYDVKTYVHYSDSYPYYIYAVKSSSDMTIVDRYAPKNESGVTRYISYEIEIPKGCTHLVVMRYKHNENVITITRRETEYISLQDQINDRSFLTKTKNICFVKKYVPYSNLDTASGKYKVASANTNSVTFEEYIPVESGKTYSYSHKLGIASSVYVYFYDGLYNFIPNRLQINNTFTVPDGASFVRIQLYSSGNTEILSEATNLQIELGDIPTDYENYEVLKYDYIPHALLKSSEEDDIHMILDAKRPIIIERNRNKKYLNFAFCTDTHLENDDGDQSGLLDIKVIKCLDNEKWIDFCVHGGDVFNSYKSSDSGNGITFDDAITRIDNAMNILGSINTPVYIAVGNHDINGKYNPTYPSGMVDNNQKISKSQFELLFQHNLRKTDNHDGCSFYKDYDDEQIRVIVFDSYITSAQTPTFDYNSLNWLANTALHLGDKRSYGVILIAHTFIHDSSSILSNLVKAFKNGLQFNDTTYGVSADFSSQGNGNFIACICGHSHEESDDVDGGFWYITSSTSYLKRSGVTSDNVYASVFTVDTDEKILYKEKLGSNGMNKAYHWDSLTSEQT